MIDGHDTTSTGPSRFMKTSAGTWGSARAPSITSGMGNERIGTIADAGSNSLSLISIPSTILRSTDPVAGAGNQISRRCSVSPGSTFPGDLRMVGRLPLSKTSPNHGQRLSALGDYDLFQPVRVSPAAG